MAIEWLGRTNLYALEKIGFKWNRKIRLSFYFLITTLIFLFSGSEQEFIYFQF